ncbi:uncharacterized oxidoreductase At4g09670-like [Cornus florida]|uniref:uncharacterized oxidoreductase At4g09670-like n=1 Tax=Cornus florida TaxID=4283 RepID=UPI00289D62E3|nr:uncharacterized oxidoreductase At4g09670-like [Cornus florida]
MAETTVRFGILGCANIARKVSRAITLAPNATIWAIDSRSIEKASRFASENDVPASAKLYGSYEVVLDDPEVDVVYVPLPTSLHVSWAVLAAEKKKHVLLEKPVALHLTELDTILEACEANGVQFMDATMWMHHHPRTAKMTEFISDKLQIGKLKSLHTSFTYDAGADFLKNDIRVKPDLDAHGALGDAGWYCIRASLWAADYDLPKTLTALREPDFNEAGVILSCGASLRWEDGRVATFYCSFLTNLSMDITALGTKGYLRVHDFVVPFQENVGPFFVASNSKFGERALGCEPIPVEHIVTTDLPQEALMVTEFATLVNGIKSKGLKPEKKWPTLSRKTQLVLDAVKVSIAKGFEPVEIVN